MTILNTYADIATFGAEIVLFAILGVVAALIGILLLDYFDDAFGDLSFAVWIIILVLGALLGGLTGAVILKEPTTRYEVTLDDNYSANKFLNEYKLIERRGDILVVEEKENDI